MHRRCFLTHLCTVLRLDIYLLVCCWNVLFVCEMTWNAENPFYGCLPKYMIRYEAFMQDCIARSRTTRGEIQCLEQLLVYLTGAVVIKDHLTRAPLGYFYNAPHWGGGGAISSPPPSDLRNYWADSKNSNGIWKTWKNCRGKTNFIDLGVTSDVTGQVKVKMFDISGLVTSASKIAMLSTNKAN